ncbi:hypothetical protein Lche_1537 [Legionella cherrii]|uniref:Uncharacterized protein n=1 Tax=Legionella cherrii TaxID=28084 RepID=A0A0W0S905_9GAMM|nr:hypothetical protein [Legionella cherrii]KTC79517.1 hypothetical protein Lche_1537 [Legionella cherrii]
MYFKWCSYIFLYRSGDRRNIFSWKIESNPFYIDKKSIPDNLKQENNKLLNAFYNLIQTQDPDPQKVSDFQQEEFSFYQKLRNNLIKALIIELQYSLTLKGHQLRKVQT